MPDYSVVDGGYGWVVVFGSFLSHFMLMGLVRSFGILYVALLRQFEQSATKTASLQACFNSVRMLESPFVSVVVRRTSARACMLGGGLLMATGLVMSAFVTSLDVMFLTFSVIAGTGAAFLFTPPYIIVVEYFDKRKGTAMSLSTLGAGLGGALMAPFVVLLLQYYAFSGCLALLGAISLHNCVAGALFRPFRQPPIARETTAQTMLIGDETQEQENGEQQMKQLPPPLPNESQTDEIKSLNTVSDDKRDSLCEGTGNRTDHCTDHSTEHCTEHCTDHSTEHCTDHSTEHCTEHCTDHSTEHCTEKHREQHEKLLVVNTDDKASRQAEGNTTNSVAGAVCGAVRRVLGSVRDNCRLFTNSTLLCYCFCIFSMPFAHGMVIFFVSDSVLLEGASDSQAALILTLFGVCDIAGRLLFGLLFDLPKIRNGSRTKLFAFIGLIDGLLVFSQSLLGTFWTHAALCCVTGIMAGGYHAQRVTIVSEFLTKSALPSIVGISIFCQGLGVLVVSMFGGFVRDYHGNYDLGYQVAGALLTVSNIALLVNYCVKGPINMRNSEMCA